MSEGGLEPPHPFGHQPLKLARLPIPPLRRSGATVANPRTPIEAREWFSNNKSSAANRHRLSRRSKGRQDGRAIPRRARSPARPLPRQDHRERRRPIDRHLLPPGAQRDDSGDDHLRRRRLAWSERVAPPDLGDHTPPRDRSGRGVALPHQRLIAAPGITTWVALLGLGLRRSRDHLGSRVLARPEHRLGHRRPRTAHPRGEPHCGGTRNVALRITHTAPHRPSRRSGRRHGDDDVGHGQRVT